MNLIVRGDESGQKDKKIFIPRINSAVMDQKKRKIGTVNDIFGPIKNPYFSVRLGKNFPKKELMGLRKKHVYVK